MKNLFISDMHNKDVKNFTTNFGLLLRKKADKPFKKMCNIFTNANIIRKNYDHSLSDSSYFEMLNSTAILKEEEEFKSKKNNIVLERYPSLDNDSYIFVANHTCPEDIETILNVLDRNAYLVLGSIESLQYNPEMYLSWLNGMIPFDIMNKEQRKEVVQKIKRVLKTNSILIFPEGSHNYNPNKLINNLFDGPVNIALQTNKKIVLVTFLKENNISYIDVSNPINVDDLYEKVKKNNINNCEKENIQKTSLLIRDKMATALYYMIERHSEHLIRSSYENLEEKLRQEKIQTAFEKLRWNRDVFDAEYLVKKTADDKKYEEVVNDMDELAAKNKVVGNARDWVLKRNDIDNKDVANRMREYWQENVKVKKLKKK